MQKRWKWPNKATSSNKWNHKANLKVGRQNGAGSNGLKACCIFQQTYTDKYRKLN